MKRETDTRQEPIDLSDHRGARGPVKAAIAVLLAAAVSEENPEQTKPEHALQFSPAKCVAEAGAPWDGTAADSPVRCVPWCQKEASRNRACSAMPITPFATSTVHKIVLAHPRPPRSPEPAAPGLSRPSPSLADPWLGSTGNDDSAWLNLRTIADVRLNDIGKAQQSSTLTWPHAPLPRSPAAPKDHAWLRRQRPRLPRASTGSLAHVCGCRNAR